MLLGLLAGAILAASPAWATSSESGQSFDIKGDLCRQATAARERVEAIPRHLLRAISLAETGRWDEGRRASFAWPWTVTAGGEGTYFPTKAAAVAHVLGLRAQGRTNIDVGCMQINLFYHPDAFASLEEAFDPAANVAYAARFLKERFGLTRSWPQAAALYHSASPEKNRPYRDKVLALWKQERRGQDPALQTVTTENPIPDGTPVRPKPMARKIIKPAPLDWARTEALNARLRLARGGSPLAPTLRAQQLDAWRKNRGLGMSVMAAAHRAQVETRRINRLRGVKAGRDAAVFATRRQEQLRRWRRTGEYEKDS